MAKKKWTRNQKIAVWAIIVPASVTIVAGGWAVVLFTTGHGLTKEKTRELKDAGLFGIIIGLEHINQEIQDKLRNYDGSYEQALEGIKNAKETGLYIGISTVATKERIKTGEIWEFITRTQFPTMLVSYERAIVRPKIFLNELCAFLGVSDQEKTALALSRISKVGGYLVTDPEWRQANQ